MGSCAKCTHRCIKNYSQLCNRYRCNRETYKYIGVQTGGDINTNLDICMYTRTHVDTHRYTHQHVHIELMYVYTERHVLDTQTHTHTEACTLTPMWAGTDIHTSVYMTHGHTLRHRHRYV